MNERSPKLQTREAPTISIGNQEVGDGCPVYIVAELSANHNGDLGRAIATVHAAKEAGADAIKLQTYTPDTITLKSDDPSFRVPGSGPWAGRNLYDLYQEAHTPWSWHPKIFDAARSCGIEIFSTPFDPTAVDFLVSLEVPAFKIASFELVDDALLAKVAATGKPVIMSTGMANTEEVIHAVDQLKQGGANSIVVLRCTSSYPAPDDSMHLSTLPTLRAVTNCLVGLSDHSLGSTASVVSVALGACLIEKHFTLSRSDGGVDSHFSLEPSEFSQLVGEVRRAEVMIGTPTFGPGVAEESNIVFRRSLYIAEDVAAGELLTTLNVRSVRPGFGLSPRFLNLVVGHRARRAISRGTPVTWDLLWD